MQIYTLPDITGDNAAHQLSATSIGALAIYIAAVGGACRFGDSNVSATRGVNVPQNDHAIDISAIGEIPLSINLSKCYVYVPSGATATISYGQ